MRTTTVLRLVVAAGVWGNPAAHAETHGLTFDQAMAIARERAPDAVADRLRIGEAEAQRVGAGRWFPEDPELEIVAGRRRGEALDSSDFELSLRQRLEVGGKRGARIDQADAAIERAQAVADDSARRAQLEVAAAFYEALRASEAERLFTADGDAARHLVTATEARAAKGEAALLDLQLARVAGSRARAAALAARADRVVAEAELAARLGLPHGDRATPVGDLASATTASSRPVRTSPAIRAAAAEGREAAAERRLGERFRWPDLALGASYAREVRDTIVMGQLSIRLPLVERGQALRASGLARERRAQAEAAALSNALRRDEATLQSRVEALRAAVSELDREAIPALEEADRLLGKSFDQGVIDVRDLLVTRRELMAARLEHAERRAALAIAVARQRLQAEVLR